MVKFDKKEMRNFDLDDLESKEWKIFDKSKKEVGKIWYHPGGGWGGTLWGRNFQESDINHGEGPKQGLHAFLKSKKGQKWMEVGRKKGQIPKI